MIRKGSGESRPAQGEAQWKTHDDQTDQDHNQAKDQACQVAGEGQRSEDHG